MDHRGLTFWRDDDPLTASDIDTAALDLDVEFARTAVAIGWCRLHAKQIVGGSFAQDPFEGEVRGADGDVNQAAARRLGEIAEPVAIQRTTARQLGATRCLLRWV